MHTALSELSGYIQSLPILDTHEHFCFPEPLARERRDVLAYIRGTYLADDLRSVGFGEREWSIRETPEEKWERLKPYLERTQNTTYYCAFQMALRELFGLDEPVGRLDYADASAPIQAAAELGETWYRRVLRRANIVCSLIDRGQPTAFEAKLLDWPALPTSPIAEPLYAPEKSGVDLFLPVLRIDLLAFCCLPEARQSLAERFGVTARTFSEFDGFLDELMHTLPARGFYAVKSAMGYYRDLRFLPAGRHAAAAAWAAGETVSETELRAFQDYVVYRLATLCGETGTVFQIHTGLRCGDTPYTDRNGPHELAPLINANPSAHFDLFHAGWPWVHQAAAMAKSLPNVYLNLNWFTAISRMQATRQLTEILDTVPMHKITWGGDAFYVEEAWTHAAIVRAILAEALGGGLGRGYWSPEVCRRMARGILWENAAELYSLKLPKE